MKTELAGMPAYLPFWRSERYGSPVTGLEVTGTHLRAAYEDGKILEWELGKSGGAPTVGSEEVAPSEDSSGVQFEGTTVKLKAFGHNVDLTCHPSKPTAWAFPDDERALYIGMKDGSIIAWDLGGGQVGNLDLSAFVIENWLAFDKENQSLTGGSVSGRTEFAALPVPRRKSFEASKPEPFRNSIGMEMAFIPAGSFKMGSTEEDDNPPHDVTLTKKFWIGAFEVTQQEWQSVMGANLSEFKDPLAPVENVNWNDCQEFCQKLTERERKAGLPELWSYVLPTEAQWEYACRATTKTEYSFGDELKPDQANFSSSAIGQTVAVGRYEPNRWGLYDMHGNVSEWCHDWNASLSKEPAIDPSGPASGGLRVSRGGVWYFSADFCRSAYRNLDGAHFRINFLGFRVVLSSSPTGQGQTAE